MSKIIMSLDQGTTSSRTILFNDMAGIIAESNAPLRCKFPKYGWVEQDPEEIWNTQRQTIESTLVKSKLSMKDITAIGITNQRETTILWDKKTGKPVHNAIVWQCRRTTDRCLELSAYKNQIKFKIRARVCFKNSLCRTSSEDNY